MLEYRARSGQTLIKPTLGVEVEEYHFDDNVGWCLKCGDLVEGVEPDARKYLCECCGETKVYGLVELALMGLIDTSESD